MLPNVRDALPSPIVNPLRALPNVGNALGNVFPNSGYALDALENVPVVGTVLTNGRKVGT